MTATATLIAPATMRLERVLPGPLERVWAYLTESDKRAKWFCGGEFDLRVGGRVQLEFDHAQLSREKETPAKHKGAEHRRFEGTITQLEPQRLLAFTMAFGERPSEVTFELAPRGKDVLLTITHRGLDERGTRVSVMSGWDVHTGILADVLNGAEPRPFWSTHARLEREYEGKIGV
jgi:uncharacterized protein YndB with AHSA1/START domain